MLPPEPERKPMFNGRLTRRRRCRKTKKEPLEGGSQELTGRRQTKWLSHSVRIQITGRPQLTPAMPNGGLTGRHCRPICLKKGRAFSFCRSRLDLIGAGCRYRDPGKQQHACEE